MLKPVYNFSINKHLLSSLHCPTCKASLHKNNLIDIFLYGLKCKNQHRFYFELRSPMLLTITKGLLLKKLTRESDLVTIKKWLTNYNFRSVLNNQLAVIIRRIYEITTDKICIAYNYEKFKYCPLCMKKLHSFEQKDIWFHGLKCSAGHKFLYRAGEGIGFYFKGEHIMLSEEMSDENLHKLIKVWLKDKQYVEMKAQLHNQIKIVMSNFIKNTDS